MSQEELRRRELRRKFTVRVNTFRRNDLLKQVVEHYVSCPRIDAIQIIWSDLDAPPPPMSFYDLSRAKGAAQARDQGKSSWMPWGGSSSSSSSKKSSSTSTKEGETGESRRLATDTAEGSSAGASSESGGGLSSSSELFPLTGDVPRVEYELHDVDSLNNRFRPILDIRTEAVFSVDDDLHIPCR